MPLTQEVSAAFFDHATDARPPKPRLFAQTRQIASCKPLIASDLLCTKGQCRSVFLLKVPARDLCRDGLWIRQDTTTIAEIDPLALQSPMVDPYALLTGLSHDGSLRLLRLILTTGVSLFGMGALAGFRDIISQLLDQLAPSELALRAWCPVGTSGVIVSYDIPRSLTEHDLTDLVALTETGVVRISGAEADIETVAEDRVLHLFLPDGIAVGTTLVALGDTPIRLSGPADGHAARPLGVWLGRRSQKIRNQTKARLTRLAEGDTIAAALLDELSCPQGDLPKATPHLLARTPTGLFYIIGLADAYQLASGVVLRDQDGDCEIPLAKACIHPRMGRVHVGFHPLPQASAPGDEIELGVLYRSGRLSGRTRVTLEALPTSLPAILSDLAPDTVARPLAQALADTLPTRRAPKTEHVIVAAGQTPVDTTIVVELADTPDLAYALAASLGARQDIHVLLTHPDRDAAPMLDQIAQDLHCIYGIGTGWLGFPSQDLWPVERMRAALAAVTTDIAFWLGQDCLPSGNRWLDAWDSLLDQPGPFIALGNGRTLDGRIVPSHAARPTAAVMNRPALNLFKTTSLCVPGQTADLETLVRNTPPQPNDHPRRDFDVTLVSAGLRPPQAMTLAQTLILNEQVHG